MNRIFLVLLLVFSTTSYAGSGFRWLTGLAHSVNLYEFIVTFCLGGLIISGIGLLYRIKLSSVKNSVVPDRTISIRNIVESYGEFIYNLVKSIMGEERASQYFPVLSFLFLFILINNLLGLVPGFLPPTEFLNTTLALGLFVFIYYNLQGVKAQGLWGHIKHYFGPVWYLAFLIFPIELVSHAVRPLSLALRLRGNMMGDHIVLSTFSDMVPLLVPVIFLFLGLFVSVVQSFVFTLLTTVYIALATEHHDHDDH
jgi:F-type H+-transporting ATPase subunit a